MFIYAPYISALMGDSASTIGTSTGIAGQLKASSAYLTRFEYYPSETIRGHVHQEDFSLVVGVDLDGRLVFDVKPKSGSRREFKFQCLRDDQGAAVTSLHPSSLDLLLARMVEQRFREVMAPGYARDINYGLYQKLYQSFIAPDSKQ